VVLRYAALLCAVSLFACDDRPAPQKKKLLAPGEPGDAAVAPDMRPRIASYPSGGAFVGDPAACSVSRVHEETKWTRTLAGCEGGLEVAVALDSIAIARTAAVLVGFDPDGSEVWHVTPGAPPPPAVLAAPTVTRDSSVVIAISPDQVVSYRKGREAWRFVLPPNDALVAAPLANQTEGVLLLTRRGVRAIGADGMVRWSTAENLEKSAE
jgi:hypothetical protein